MLAMPECYLCLNVSGDLYLKVFSVQRSLYGWMLVTNGGGDLLLNALSAKCI